MNTNRVSLIAAIGAASWMLAACSGSEPPAVADDDCVVREVTLPEDKTAELARLLDEFDPVALGNLLRDNARLLPPNVPAIEGREAILEHYKGSIAKELDYEVTPLTRVMVGNVGLAEDFGRTDDFDFFGRWDVVGHVAGCSLPRGGAQSVVSHHALMAALRIRSRRATPPSGQP